MSQILSKSRRLNQLIRQALSAILMLFAFSSVLYAQEGITVRGTVIDDTEEPLIGASIKVKGKTGVGTVADMDGNFQLTVPSEQSVLVFSYVGMSSKEVKVGKQRNFKITLEDNTQMDPRVLVVSVQPSQVIFPVLLPSHHQVSLVKKIPASIFVVRRLGIRMHSL